MCSTAAFSTDKGLMIHQAQWCEGWEERGGSSSAAAVSWAEAPDVSSEHYDADYGGHEWFSDGPTLEGASDEHEHEHSDAPRSEHLVVDWLSDMDATRPEQTMAPGLIGLARIQLQSGIPRSGVDSILRWARQHIVGKPEDEVNAWLPSCGTAYQRQVDAQLVDSRLAGFSPVEISCEGFVYALYLKSGLDVARVLLDRHRNENLVFRYQEVRNADGQRLFGDLHTADAWKDLQDQVGSDKDLVTLIAGGDETLVSNFAGRKAYPFVLTLGNLPLPVRERHDGREVWALLPLLDDQHTKKVRKTQWYRDHKKAVTWAAMRAVLETVDPCVQVWWNRNGNVGL